MTAQQPGDVKVLFLAGKGRSGGTLLAALLGQLPGFFKPSPPPLWSPLLLGGVGR